MILAQRAQPALSTMKVTSDEEIIVDRMIAASQRKGEVALPSFGRDLVPYFVPGTEMWTENDVNINTDVDSFRREGASLLDIPVPTFRETSVKGGKTVAISVNGKRETKLRTRSRNKRKEDTGLVDMQTSLKPLKVGHGDRTSSAVSPTSPFGLSTSVSTSSSDCDVSERESRQNVSCNNYGQRPPPQPLSSSAPGAWSFSTSVPSSSVTGPQKMPLNQVLATSPSSPELRRLNCANSALLRSSINEKWAGPAYANSPPPSCVPLPTFACKKSTGSYLSQMAVSSKTDESAGCSLIVHSAPVSPAPSTIPATATVLSVDAFFGKRNQARQSGISNALAPRRLLNMDVEVLASSGRCIPIEVNEATTSLKKILQII